jgi:hypothetical protein
MAQTLFKVLSFVAFLASFAWFLRPGEDWQFAWSPFVTMCVTLATYVGAHIVSPLKSDLTTTDNSKTETTNLLSAADLELCEAFSNLFSPKLMSFYQEHSFYDSFSPTYLKPLFDYVDGWVTVHYRFNDVDLEDAHARFRRKAAEFSHALTQYTGQENGRATVAPSNFAGGDYPEWVNENARKLNNLASEFVSYHESFAKYMNKRIAQNPFAT